MLMTGSRRASTSLPRALVNSASRSRRFASARAGSLVFDGISRVKSRDSNAARRNSRVGRSQTA
jgi:hypothetical protein